jgi:hypothetical protein
MLITATVAAALAAAVPAWAGDGRLAQEAVARGVPFWLTAAAATFLVLSGAAMLLIGLISRRRGRPGR